MGQTIMNQSGISETCQNNVHTTIAIQKGTKEKLNNNRAPGQCYDGFITELVDYWERYRIGSSLCGPGRPIRHEVER
jgi:hypothetical protein